LLFSGGTGGTRGTALISLKKTGSPGRGT